MGNSRQMRLASGEGPSSSDILLAHAGRMEGFMAQKNCGIDQYGPVSSGTLTS